MSQRLLLITLLLLLAVAMLPYTVAQAECDFSFSNYARAVQLHDMGDYTRALKHYQCALLEDPDSAIIPILIDNVQEDIANASSAWARAEEWASATACDPAKDHARLGRDAFEAGDDNWALIHLQCAILRDPALVDALYLTGTIYFSRGETRDAKYYYDRAERAAAADRQADDDLLTVLLGDDARSVLDADEQPNLSLTSPDPGESGEYRPPGHDYQRTVLRVIWTRQPGRAEPRQADSGSAISQLQAALAQDPTRVDLRCELGRRYMARGDYAAAYVQFSSLIEERLGEYCGDGERPAEYMATAPGSTPSAMVAPERVSPAEEQYQEGLRFMADGMRYVAANIFLELLDLDPLHLEARCQLGMIYREWAHYRAAIEQFDAILRQDPQNSCARTNRTEAARDMLAILTPLVVDDYFHYARTYIRMGEWELARDAFLAGLEIDPSRHDVRCELGMLYAQLGDDRAALDQFDLALFANDMDSCARANRRSVLQRLRDG